MFKYSESTAGIKQSSHSSGETSESLHYTLAIYGQMTWLNPSSFKAFDLDTGNVVYVRIRKVWARISWDNNIGLEDEELDEKIVYERKSNEFLYKNSSVEFILHTDLRSEAFLYFRPVTGLECCSRYYGGLSCHQPQLDLQWIGSSTDSKQIVC